MDDTLADTSGLYRKAIPPTPLGVGLLALPFMNTVTLRVYENALVCEVDGQVVSVAYALQALATLGLTAPPRNDLTHEEMLALDDLVEIERDEDGTPYESAARDRSVTLSQGVLRQLFAAYRDMQRGWTYLALRAHAASEESARLRAQTIRAEEAYKSGFYAGARYVDPQQQPNVLYMPTETCFDAWIATRAGQEGAKEESDE